MRRTLFLMNRLVIMFMLRFVSHWVPQSDFHAHIVSNTSLVISVTLFSSMILWEAENCLNKPSHAIYPTVQYYALRTRGYYWYTFHIRDTLLLRSTWRVTAQVIHVCSKAHAMFQLVRCSCHCAPLKTHFSEKNSIDFTCHASWCKFTTDKALKIVIVISILCVQRRFSAYKQVFSPVMYVKCVVYTVG